MKRSWLEMDGSHDLHSISLSSSSHLYSFQDWDLKNIGILNADISHYMESATPFYVDDLSTGYLQDVLFEFRSKRRRLFMFDGRGESRPAEVLTEEGWTRSVVDNYCQDLSILSQGISELKPGEETNPETYESSSSSQKDLSADNQWNNDKENNLYTTDPLHSSEKRKKKVVYPFAVVKPGGFEGAATLNDINRRILMPPTRQLRHPVGDFACRSLLSPDGPGLSGKSIVSFTKIQTRGRGTITIIRTRD